MTTKTQSLVERAQLTEAEREVIFLDTRPYESRGQAEEFGVEVASAQLSKAMWEVVDYMDERLKQNAVIRRTIFASGFSAARGEIEGMLEAAGIKRPGDAPLRKV